MANEQQRYDMSEKIWTVLEPYLAGRHGPWDRIAAVPLSARARRAPDRQSGRARERGTGASVLRAALSPWLLPRLAVQSFRTWFAVRFQKVTTP